MEASSVVRHCVALLMATQLCQSAVLQKHSSEPLMSDEKRLIRRLLRYYDHVGVVGRPVHNQSQTVFVKYGLALVQIIGLDEKNQILTTNVWSRYQWIDILLRWEPGDYGGLKNVRVPVTQIWTPDVVLYNYADMRLKEFRDAMAVVESDGTVLWIPPALFRSSCSIDITQFPFDVQTCDLKFGSWTYDGFNLDIDFYNNVSQVDVSDYTASNEWEVLSHPAQKNVKYYSCCNAPYPDLTFTVSLRRVAAFYNYVLVLPCVLLSFLTLVIFWLPPESPAKMMLGMNIFVAFFVLLLLLADSTPPAASSIPLIGAYFCLNMIIITLSTFLSIIVLNLYIRGDRRNQVPLWLRRLTVDGLAHVLCMTELLDATDSCRHLASQNVQQQPASTASSHSQTLPCVDRRRRTDGSRKRPVTLKTYAVTPPRHILVDKCCTLHCGRPAALLHGRVHRLRLTSRRLERDVTDINRYLRVYLGRLNDAEQQNRVAREWRLVARLLDRLFFFMYVSTVAVSLATIFPKG